MRETWESASFPPLASLFINEIKEIYVTKSFSFDLHFPVITYIAKIFQHLQQKYFIFKSHTRISL